ncbi:MAG TPA: glycosyltransferase family 2 protein [Candidatus Hydrogenedentes bacterium]|nr:glycosyltransferase family 2 protein [Candidatus Hydrogenedentota bacterium]
MNTPLVHTLVLNWNGLEHLQACFESLLAQTHPNARFILLDNASVDASVEFVQSRFGHDPRVGILRIGQNMGWSGANNVGIEQAMQAGADYVFLLNNDTAVEPDAIERLVAMAESDATLGAIAPKMLLYNAPELLNSIGIECSLIGCCWDIGLGRLDDDRWNEARPVIGVCGGAALFRVEALRRSGLAPAEFEFYLDDLDLCLRIWGAGYRIVTCPEARVRHKFSATLGSRQWARRKYRWNTRNRFWLMLRNYPADKAVCALPAVASGEMRAVGRALLEGEFWRVGAHMQAWIAALTYLPRAIRLRRQRRAEGLDMSRFWPYVRRDRRFFEGIELPVNGWYVPREVQGVSVRPIGRCATMNALSGRLRILHANAYPRLGETHVVVWQHGAILKTLQTLEKEILEVDVADGPVEFRANRIFFAEDTRESIDIGGWLAVEQA